MPTTIADIAEAAAQLGALNARNEKYPTGQAAAANTALGALFDGAEHLNSAGNREAVYYAFVRGFDEARSA